MNRHLLLSGVLLALLGGLSATVAAQAPMIPDWENAAKFELVASQSPIRPGDNLEVAVVAELEEGYHLYGPEEAFPTATVVELMEGGAFEGGDPAYPPPIRRDLSGLGEYDLYEGTIAIRIPVTSVFERGRSADAEVLVRYQLCTDNACSAPTSTTLELRLPAAKAGAPVKKLHSEIFVESR
jgi:hypothetical protein